MKRSFVKLAAAAVLASAAILPTSSPAEAADPGCSYNRVCVWDFRNFSTRLGLLNGSSGQYLFRTPYVGNHLNDKISSYRIGYSGTKFKYVVFYEHAYDPRNQTGYGPYFYDRHNHGIPYLHQISHPYGGSWEDKISSFDEAY